MRECQPIKNAAASGRVEEGEMQTDFTATDRSQMSEEATIKILRKYQDLLGFGT
jgi:hypothetical protein